MMMYRNVLLFLVFAVGNLFAQSQILPKKYMTFKEKIVHGTTSRRNVPVPEKTERTSNQKGSINLSFDETIPDSLKFALNAAKEAWEYKIPLDETIFVTALMAPLEEDVAVQTDVSYCEEEELSGCPMTLVSQIKGLSFSQEDSPDAYITLNSGLPWNCSFSTEKSAGFNAYTMGLRAFAMALGFGSSIYQDEGDEGKFYLFNIFPTYFDRKIHNGNTYLPTVEEGSTAMKEFITSNSLVVDGESRQYELYSPTIYEPSRSLMYLKDSLSLMSVSVKEGCKVMSIDKGTLDILTGLGWAFSDDRCKILCDDIADNGIGSSYSPHRFSLEKDDVEKYAWTFWLKDRQGNYVSIRKDNGSVFEIAEVEDASNYHTNLNGDLIGKIECEYMLDGKWHRAMPFHLSLELKPVIVSVDELIRIPRGAYTFSVSSCIRYTGADYITVEVEEEYNTTLRSYRFDEPFLAHVLTGEISSLYYSWVTIIAQNKYGTAHKTLEFKPNGTIQTTALDKELILSDTGEAPLVELYDIQGVCIFKGPHTGLNEKSLPRGVYIKKENKKGKTKACKLIIR